MERPEPSRERTEEETAALEHALDHFIITDESELPDEIVFDLARHAAPMLATMAKAMTQPGDFANLMRSDHNSMSHAVMYLCVRELVRRRTQEKKAAQGAPFLWWHPGRQSGAMCVGGTRVTVNAIQSIDAQGNPGDVAKAYPNLTTEQIELALLYRATQTNAEMERAARLLDENGQLQESLHVVRGHLTDAMACDGHDFDDPTCECAWEDADGE